ncbi:hypothetical protein JCM10369A_38900 [Nocardioides pyridinolyticus]
MATATCPSCGAQTEYAPGTAVLKCASCGAEQQIAETAAVVREHSYDAWLGLAGTKDVATIGAHVLRCQGCGATTETVDLAGSCQFCSGALIAVEQPEGLVQAEAVVPFQVDRRGAQVAFGAWVKSRWFAPNALKSVRSTEGLQGTYLPHWTYDAHTETDYVGERGDYYYVTKTRQVSDGKGGTRTETYQERHTRWTRASGHVSRTFDDVLVVGSTRIEPAKVEKMGPWRLEDARPFQADYLTGYSALRYDVDPDDGSATARQRMADTVEDDCRSDIGGDEQRVSDMDITYSQAMFKLVLMPLWIATYMYNGKAWTVLVNANTGEVVGDRPYSALKITAAVVAAVLVVALVVAAFALA